jgi:hypothetical protein
MRRGASKRGADETLLKVGLFWIALDLVKISVAGIIHFETRGHRPETRGNKRLRDHEDALTSAILGK